MKFRIQRIKTVLPSSNYYAFDQKLPYNLLSIQSNAPSGIPEQEAFQNLLVNKNCTLEDLHTAKNIHLNGLQDISALKTAFTALGINSTVTPVEFVIVTWL